MTCHARLPSKGKMLSAGSCHCLTCLFIYLFFIIATYIVLPLTDCEPCWSLNQEPQVQQGRSTNHYGTVLPTILNVVTSLIVMPTNLHHSEKRNCL